MSRPNNLASNETQKSQSRNLPKDTRDPDLHKFKLFSTCFGQKPAKTDLGSLNTGRFRWGYWDTLSVWPYKHQLMLDFVHEYYDEKMSDVWLKWKYFPCQIYAHRLRSLIVLSGSAFQPFFCCSCLWVDGVGVDSSLHSVCLWGRCIDPYATHTLAMINASRHGVHGVGNSFKRERTFAKMSPSSCFISLASILPSAYSNIELTKNKDVFKLEK